jgi:2'-5' RNA ligase
MPSVRTFIAIELSSEVLAALGQVQARLRRGEGGQAGRWVKAEGVHLTLKFLGEVPSERLEAIYQAVDQACLGCAPFELTVAELGCFPNLRRPRVVWVGVQEETGQLAGLQEAVERELNRLGFPPEGRKFTPHLTLARVQDRASPREIEALGKAVGATQIGELARMQVDAVSVMKSDLQPEGAVYTELFHAPLGGSAHG